jgi:hypothetical protein
MEERDLALIEELIPQDEELRQLMMEHRALEQELDKYAAKRYLTPAEEMERKRMQKVKLAGKDRIEAILSAHRRKTKQQGMGRTA